MKKDVIERYNNPAGHIDEKELHILAESEDPAGGTDLSAITAVTGISVAITLAWKWCPSHSCTDSCNWPD